MKRRHRTPEANPPAARASDEDAALSLRHLRFGWWSLLLFLLLGLVLEAFHGFKADWYLGVAHAPRRFSWTLAHAHGTLLAVVNVRRSPRRRLVGC